MDIRQYFRKMREVEAGLSDEFPILVSLETSDGGKAGMIFEATRSNAARMLVEARAALASDEQREQYVERLATAKKAADTADMMKRLQLAIVEDADLQAQLSTRRSTDPSRNGK